ncbi:MAG: heavy-metal-associated domain-containing protein [Bacteroidales bacterium]|nr:heavy-metal-associated domain-containing protein [Bacteroidales bacterium]
MKTNHFFIIAFLVFAFTISANAQEKTNSIDTLNFQVSGVCNSCKARIENAALIKGVKQANWNKETQMLTVVFNSTKTTEDNIHKSIADAGHDTEKIKASDEAYSKLPKCCAYRDGIKVH